MREEFPSEVPIPANDNESEAARKKEREDTYTEIGVFRNMVLASDLLVKEKNTFLEKIDKILDALFNEESAPSEALSRIQTLAKEYGFDSYFQTT